MAVPGIGKPKHGFLEIKGLNQEKKYSRRSFWVITVVAALAAAGVSAGAYWGIGILKQYLAAPLPSEEILANLSIAMEYVDQMQPFFYQLAVPVCMAAILIAGWIFWGVLRLFVSGVFQTVEAGREEETAATPKKKDFIDHKIEQEQKQRLFLHTLSVMQREGRLLDFFDEDLSRYEDGQIGAAVRSIQEDCKKAVKKYIDPRPVIEKEEGEPVLVEKGFDIDSIKLVGNITGEPPFEGILKHRGWKAGRKDLPRLTQVQDATVMAPAEVEIR